MFECNQFSIIALGSSSKGGHRKLKFPERKISIIFMVGYKAPSSKLRNPRLYPSTFLDLMAADTQERKLEKFFSIESRSLVSGDNELRLGTLSCHGRVAIQTPHYVAITSRGAVPHLSQDMMRDNTAIKGIYVALEDCE